MVAEPRDLRPSGNRPASDLEARRTAYAVTRRVHNAVGSPTPDPRTGDLRYQNSDVRPQTLGSGTSPTYFAFGRSSPSTKTSRSHGSTIIACVAKAW
jgi:hypothetical protein